MPVDRDDVDDLVDLLELLRNLCDADDDCRYLQRALHRYAGLYPIALFREDVVRAIRTTTNAKWST